MNPLLTSVLLAACLVRGDVLSLRGDSLPGVEVLHAESGVTLGVSAVDGTFSVEAPDSTADEVVLEFRHEDWLTRVARLRCDSPATVRLAPRVYQLEFFEVSATRLERSLESSPERVEELDEVEVSAAAGSSPSLAQAVQQLPGVGAVGRDGFTSAPTIRGMGRDRSLILLEGMRLSADRGVGPSGSFLDPFLVRSVSVVRGASGVAYGSGAIGGVLSVGLGPVSEETTVSGRLEGASNGDGRLVAGRLGGGLRGGWRGAVGGFARAADDYSFPDGDGAAAGDARNSGFENRGGVAVAERTIGSGRVRAAGLVTRATDVGRPTTREGRLDTIEREDHDLATLRYLREDDANRTELAIGFHRPQTVNRAERFEDDGARSRTSRLENTSTDLSLATLIERPQPVGSWLGGVDAFFRGDVDAEETTVRYDDEGPGAPETAFLIRDGRRLDLGIFGGWKRPIGYLGEFRLAGRLDWARRDADERSSSSWVSPSFSVGAVIPWNHAWAVTGSLGRSFRAPRIQELYFQGDRPGGSRLANPDLDPETAWSLEGGLRWAGGDWKAEGVLWGLAADQLIVQLPVDAAADTLRSENESSGLLGGVELGVAWRPDDGRASASLAYALLTGDGDDGEPLPDIPSGEVRLTGAVRAWSSAGRTIRFRTSLRAGGAKTPLPAGVEERAWSNWLGATAIGGDEEPHPGYARWDGGVELSLSDVGRLDLAVENLLDARYLDRPESGAYPQPGRSFRVTLTLGKT